MSGISYAPALRERTWDFDLTPEMDDHAFIEVRHGSSWCGYLRGFEVLIDGELVGHAYRGSPAQCRVRPGRHTLSAKMDWVWTQPVSVYLAADDRAVFRCGIDSIYAWLMKGMTFLIGVEIAVAGLIEFKSLMVNDPWMCKPATLDISLVCLLLSFAALGVCELIVFSAMRPGAPPGKVFRLTRIPDGSEPPQM